MVVVGPELGSVPVLGVCRRWVMVVVGPELGSVPVLGVCRRPLVGTRRPQLERFAILRTPLAGVACPPPDPGAGRCAVPRAQPRAVPPVGPRRGSTLALRR